MQVEWSIVLPPPIRRANRSLTARLFSTQTQISTQGEKGLLAIACSPNFIVDRTPYLHMNPSTANTTDILQYRTLTTDLQRADTSTANTILVVQQPAGAGFLNHKRGMLAFGALGRLLIGLGDGGSGGDPLNNPRSRNVLLGKLLRVEVGSDAFPADPDRDYAILVDNPFVGGGGSPEIWALGLRNALVGSVDTVAGDVLIGDVGQAAIEEINRIPASSTGPLNYGWNRREGSQPYLGGADDPSFLLLVTEYPHGPGPFSGNSVTGGILYRGPIEVLQGLYIFGDFRPAPNVWSVPAASLTPDAILPTNSLTNRNTAFTPDVGQFTCLVNFGTNTDGSLYLVEFCTGQIFAVEPNPLSPLRPRPAMTDNRHRGS